MWLIALYHNQGGPLVPDQLPEGDRMKWQPLARADAPLDARPIRAHRQPLYRPIIGRIMVLPRCLPGARGPSSS